MYTNVSGSCFAQELSMDSFLVSDTINSNDSISVAGVNLPATDYSLTQEIISDVVIAYAMLEKTEQYKQEFDKQSERLLQKLHSAGLERELIYAVQALVTQKLSAFKCDSNKVSLEDQINYCIVELEKTPEFAQAKTYFADIVTFVMIREQYIQLIAQFMAIQNQFKQKKEQFLSCGYTEQQFAAVVNALINELKANCSRTNQ